MLLKKNIIIIVLIYLTVLAYFYFVNPFAKKSDVSDEELQSLKNQIIPAAGFELPIEWNDLGKQMLETGVIEKEKIEKIYQSRGGLDERYQKLLYNDNNGKITINNENANFLLTLFWGLGLANKNSILESGPMMQNDQPSNFASTGGWIIAKNNPMDHYSKHQFITLTDKQQKLVEEVSKNIYRPCCNNSTYFPDCNHGMAMLGLLELMASQNINEREMYKNALKVNSYWFPTTYLTIAKYLDMNGRDWDKTEPKIILGKYYSSSNGFQKIQSQVSILSLNNGSCSI